MLRSAHSLWQVVGVDGAGDVAEAVLAALDVVVAERVQAEQVHVRADRGAGGQLLPQGLVGATEVVKLEQGGRRHNHRVVLFFFQIPSLDGDTGRLPPPL